MTIFHDEIEIEDFEYDEDDEMYYYPCPCGDRFQISKEELMAGEEVATCPSCSLVVKVVYDLEKFKAEAEEVHKDEGEKEADKSITWWIPTCCGFTESGLSSQEVVQSRTKFSYVHTLL